MDRNQFIGIVLISILLLVYVTYFAPEAPVAPEADLVENTQQTQNQPSDITSSTTENLIEDDSLRQALAGQKYGALSLAMNGSARDITLENEDISVIISSKGGEIKDVLLKDYLTYDKAPLHLINAENNDFALSLPLRAGALDIRELYFDVESQSKIGGDTTRLILTANAGAGKSIRQIYTLAPSGFVVNYNIQLQGMQSELAGENLAITWKHDMLRVEEDLAQSRQRSGITYFTADKSFEELAPTNEIEEETETQDILWAGNKYRFFTAAIISDKGFKNGLIRASGDDENDQIIKSGEFQLDLPISNLQDENLAFYFGPNSYKVMKQVTTGFEENVYLGYVFVSWVNKWIVINIFYFLEQYISNYGVIIIILVLLIKMALLPLSYKSYISMAKMKVLKPELDELKEKVGGDMTKMQTEQMQLYRKVGVNPLSGCIPVVLQMPILFALFFFFPNSIELRQESFLWAHDLSTYDVFFRLPFTIPFYGSHVSAFTLLMTASTILYTWSNNQVSSVTGPMKSLGYAMPVVFMVVLNSFPAGLSFYYFVSNLVTFGQQAVIRRFVNDDKIKQILEENKKKNANKKKSKFQQRLEDAMRASEEQKKKGLPGTGAKKK
ncbi:membrane protein insertase YidC [Peijinzhouia sedimentorum]